MALKHTAWAWATGTPNERAEMVRRHASSGRSGLTDENLRNLFSLTSEGLSKILNGDDWKPEYDRDHG